MRGGGFVVIYEEVIVDNKSEGLVVEYASLFYRGQGCVEGFGPLTGDAEHVIFVGCTVGVNKWAFEGRTSVLGIRLPSPRGGNRELPGWGRVAEMMSLRPGNTCSKQCYESLVQIAADRREYKNMNESHEWMKEGGDYNEYIIRLATENSVIGFHSGGGWIMIGINHSKQRMCRVRCDRNEDSGVLFRSLQLSFAYAVDDKIETPSWYGGDAIRVVQGFLDWAGELVGVADAPSLHDVIERAGSCGS